MLCRPQIKINTVPGKEIRRNLAVCLPRAGLVFPNTSRDPSAGQLSLRLMPI